MKRTTAKVPRKGPRDETRDLSLVQEIARELSAGRVRGSLTRLARLSGISLDSLRLLKRSQHAAGARKVSSTRLRILALLLAAHREGLLNRLVNAAEDLEREWRGNHPDAIG